MGLTKVTTKLTSLQNPTANYETVFLVDTGAAESAAPRERAGQNWCRSRR